MRYELLSIVDVEFVVSWARPNCVFDFDAKHVPLAKTSCVLCGAGNELVMVFEANRKVGQRLKVVSVKSTSTMELITFRITRIEYYAAPNSIRIKSIVACVCHHYPINFLFGAQISGADRRIADKSDIASMVVFVCADKFPITIWNDIKMLSALHEPLCIHKNKFHEFMVYLLVCINSLSIAHIEWPVIHAEYDVPVTASYRCVQFGYDTLVK